jgi:hypothetical protein
MCLALLIFLVQQKRFVVPTHALCEYKSGHSEANAPEH